MAADRVTVATEESIRNEINELESRLSEAKLHLQEFQSDQNGAQTPQSLDSDAAIRASQPPEISQTPTISSTHFLLLLADSALPLGSFSFSSGLESYLAHNPRRSTFTAFLPSSISSYASTSLPFLLAAHRQPSSLAELDDALDAAVICAVGRRASVAQGRALLSIWERSFRSALQGVDAEARILRDFSSLLREESKMDIPLASAHLAPLFGVVCAAMGLTLRQTAYVFILSHVKALVSAAVRASMFGPYQAQKVLAGEAVQRWIDIVVDREWNTAPEDAGQSVPVMDLWIGRHDLLYSRIFNS